ncbi:hypothetical protein LCGC14_0585360 [marine sediment metagenome]|uniref:Exonuclease domain-containing protein n=1 Tax=marine sediment metagenome TaxID=412755 RepID=A0A0F9RK88_9ZZZZ
MNLLVIDTETGGINASEHALLQVAAIPVTRENVNAEWMPIKDDPVFDAEFNHFIAPHTGLKLTEEAFAINRLDYDWILNNGIEEAEVIKRLVEFASQYRNDRLFPVLCGWNLHFDIAFLEAAFKRSAIPWPFTAVSLDVSQRWRWDNIQLYDNYIFGGIAKAADVLLGKSVEHDALADVRLTIDLLNAFVRSEDQAVVVG